MSGSRLFEDAELRPDLFHWNGGMPAGSLRFWLENNAWIGAVPADLLAFWQRTGGGDIFETETILGPLGCPELGDDIAAVNREMRSRGMPKRYVIYHVGLTVSAVDTVSGDYVELTPEHFGVTRRFASLEEWYTATLRSEYAQRYELP